MQGPGYDVIVALSERSRGTSPEIAVVYQDHDVATAVLVNPDGSFMPDNQLVMLEDPQ
jgi:hypothetical protein